MDIFQAIFKNLILNEVDIPISRNILKRLNEIDQDATFDDLLDPANLQGQRKKRLGRELISYNISSILL